MRIQADVDHFGDVVGDGGELFEVCDIKHGNSHLEHQIGDDSGQVGVAGSLAVSVDAALHLAHTQVDGDQG